MAKSGQTLDFTAEEILTADSIIECGLPLEMWQQFSAMTEDAKSILRYYVLLSKDQQIKFLEILQQEIANNHKSA